MVDKLFVWFAYVLMEVNLVFTYKLQVTIANRHVQVWEHLVEYYFCNGTNYSTRHFQGANSITELKCVRKKQWVKM